MQPCNRYLKPNSFGFVGVSNGVPRVDDNNITPLAYPVNPFFQIIFLRSAKNRINMLKIRIKKFFKKFEIGGILESSEKRNNFHKVLLSIYKDIKRYIEKTGILPL